MNTLFWGNVIMLIGSVIMVLSGFAKNKNNAVVLQTVQIGIMAFGMVVLGSFGCAIVNLFSCARNILSYKGKLNYMMKACLVVFSTGVSLFVNNLGIIGILPIICFILYTLFMNTEDFVKFKLLVIAGSICFTIHDFYVQSYTSAIFDVFTIVASAISIYYYCKPKNKSITVLKCVE